MTKKSKRDELIERAARLYAIERTTALITRTRDRLEEDHLPPLGEFERVGAVATIAVLEAVRAHLIEDDRRLVNASKKPPRKRGARS